MQRLTFRDVADEVDAIRETERQAALCQSARLSRQQRAGEGIGFHVDP